MRHENLDVTFKRYIGVDQDRMRGAMDSLRPAWPIQQNSCHETSLMAEPISSNAAGSWQGRAGK